MKIISLIIIQLICLQFVFSQNTQLWSIDFNEGDYYSSNLKIFNDTIKLDYHYSNRVIQIGFDINGKLLYQFPNTPEYDFDEILVYKFDSRNNIYTLRRKGYNYGEETEINKFSPKSDLIWKYNFPFESDTTYFPFKLGIINDSCLFVTLYKGYDYKEYVGEVIYMAPTKKIYMLYAFNANGEKLWELNYKKISSTIEYFFNTSNNAAYFRGDSIVKIEPDKTITKFPLIAENTDNTKYLLNDKNIKVTTHYWGFGIVLQNENFQNVRNITYQFNDDDYKMREKVNSKFMDSQGNLYLTGIQHDKIIEEDDKYNTNILTMKIDKYGKLIWKSNYDYGKNYTDIGTAITGKDGILYVGGYSGNQETDKFYDLLVLKIDAESGKVINEFRKPGLEIDMDILVGNVKSRIHVFETGEIAFFCVNKHWYGDYFNLKTFVITGENFNGKHSPKPANKIDNYVYPNPVRNNRINIVNNQFIQYSITTINGVPICQGNLNELNEETAITIPVISKGIYLIQLLNKDELVTKKLIIE